MTPETLKEALVALQPAVTFDETGEFLTVLVPAAEFKGLMTHLKNDDAYWFDFLFCLTCIDWKTHLMMVYHLLSRKHKHQLVVKVKLDDIENPQIATVCDIWKTANFHEREVYDLFGVRFTGHPDLRRLFLEEDWAGHPLRKNYVDENMIAL